MKNIKFNNATVELNNEGTSGILAAEITDSALIKNVHVSDSTVKGEYSGGIVGEVLDSDSTVTLSSAKDVSLDTTGRGGGIIGLNDGKLKKSYTLRISLEDESGDSGLLVGTNKYGSSISNSYSRDMVQYTAYGNTRSTASLVGYSLSDVSNVYNTSGAFDTTSEVSNGYYNSDSASGSIGTGLTTNEMQGSNANSNMSGFDFTSVWNTRSGNYPELQDNTE